MRLSVGMVVVALAFAARTGAAPLELHGQVVDVGGKPVADARVFLAAPAAVGTVAPPAASTTSAADGSFTITADAPPNVDEGFGHRPYDVYAECVDAGGRLVALGPGPDAVFATWSGRQVITVHPLVSRKIRFTFHGKPAAGVRVMATACIWRTASGQKWNTSASGCGGALITATDSRGVATFSALPTPDRISLSVLDERFVDLESSPAVSVMDANKVPVIALEAGSTVEGTVRYADTVQPAVGVQVAAARRQPGGRWQGVTDSTGHYRITRVGAGELALGLAFPFGQALEYTCKAVRGVSVAPGTVSKGNDLSVIDGVPLRVTVRDKVSNVPSIQIVCVHSLAAPTEERLTQMVQTDKSGNVNVRVPAGPVTLMIFGDEITTAEADVAEGQPAVISMAVPPATPRFPVEGVVSGPDGTPVAGASVVLSQPTSYVLHRTRTDAQGRYHFNPDQMGPKSCLWATRGTDSSLLSVPVGGAGPKDLRLVARAAATVTGKVTSEHGRPAVGALVTLYMWYGGTGTSFTTAQTDGFGRYRFTSLPPNERYSVDARSAGCSTASGGLFTPRPSTVFAQQTLNIVPADSTLDGKVVDGVGKPVGGVQIKVVEVASLDAMVSTDRNGRFRLAHLPRGKATLLAYRDNVQIGGRAARTGDHGVVVRVSNAPTRRGVEPSEDYSAVVGKEAPKLDASAWVNGRPLRLADLRGKVVLLEFWGRTCGYCASELPLVEKLHARFGTRGFVAIGVHNADDPAAVRQYVAKRRYKLPVAIDRPSTRGEQAGRTFAAYHVPYAPRAAVLDKDGKVVMVGTTREAEAAVIRLFGGQ